jgi:hypothetical protein
MVVGRGAMECSAATDAARDGGIARHVAVRRKGGVVKPQHEVKRVEIGDFCFFIREWGFLGEQARYLLGACWTRAAPARERGVQTDTPWMNVLIRVLAFL